MSTRRQFFATLGKALGAGGLLLPCSGKGALALPTDLGKAAQLPVTVTALPVSREPCSFANSAKRCTAVTSPGIPRKATGSGTP